MKSIALRWLARVVAAVVAVAAWLVWWRVVAEGGRRTRVEGLVGDPEVLEAAEEYSREVGVSYAAAVRRAGEYAREISGHPDARLYLRVGVPLAGKIVRFLYGGRLRSEGGENVPEPGGEDGVVFVMNHRSNLDYVVLGHLLEGRAALSFAAGEWALFRPLGPLVRAMGSFFVRRGSGDALYRRVLERYLQTGLEQGLTPAVFVEGGLSRDGRLREPKTGLLDYALRRFDPDGKRDLLFVPVAINYDWVLEDGNLPAPGDPNPSGVRSVFSTIFFILRRLLDALRSPDRLGRVAVRFGTPLSARRWTKDRDVDFRSLDREERAGRVRALAGDLMRSISDLVPITPVPVATRVLLQFPDEASHREDVVRRSRKILSELERNEAYDDFEGKADIEVALRLLVSRGLVIQDGSMYRAAPDGVKLLRFYAASISHLFPDDGEESG